MDWIYFTIRYTPFWAVPIIFIAAEFGYLFWLKSYKKSAIAFFGVAGVAFLAIIYYVIAGGPDRAVKFFIDLIG